MEKGTLLTAISWGPGGWRELMDVHRTNTKGGGGLLDKKGGRGGVRETLKALNEPLYSAKETTLIPDGSEGERGVTSN